MHHRHKLVNSHSLFNRLIVDLNVLEDQKAARVILFGERAIALGPKIS